EIEVRPAHCGIEIVAHPTEEILHSTAASEHGSNISQLVRAPPQPNIIGPTRMETGLPYAPRCTAQPGRPGKSRVIVAVARSRHRHIDGENERAALRCGRKI